MTLALNSWLNPDVEDIPKKVKQTRQLQGGFPVPEPTLTFTA
jgi:hypothetical protein